MIIRKSHKIIIGVIFLFILVIGYLYFFTRTFYPNDQFSYDENGKRHGLSIIYNRDNGKLFEKGNYVHGKKNGVWTVWRPDGSKWYSVTYNNDVMQGPVITWDDKGIIHSTAEYANNLKNGLNIIYSKEKILIKGSYINDLKDGEWLTYWYGNGILESIAHYDQGNPVGYWCYYDLDGKKQEEFVVETNQQTRWYSNGQKKSEGQLINNQKQGLWSFWSEDSQLEKQGQYKDDKEEGEWINWDKIGYSKNDYIILTQLSYLNGKLNGKWQRFYTNGKVAIEGKYKQNKKQGTWHQWFVNGQPRETISYDDNGMRQGLMTQWHSSGNKEMEAYFVDDYWQGPATRWFSDGEKASEGNYDRFEKDGIWHYWYADKNHTMKEQGRYDHGKPVGLWQSWQEDGSPLPNKYY